ncbi:SH3 domain-containing protein [Peptostreptococcus stomatis]|uniref:SH3 domain-containing protein n=1 Tax=Peptostreptococcus stomatis TaxID=341694 RepID=UPI0028D47244|nr:SH3 domain-containing protein [Peptostreptococcus stomatis]
MLELSKTIKKLALISIVFLLALTLGACKSQDKEDKKEVKVDSLSEKIAKSYGQVLDKADMYDYQDEGQEAKEYEYAIVKMDGDKIPQLLLSKNTELRYVKVFSYNEKEDKLIECDESIVYGASGRGGFRGAILARSDYKGLEYIMTLGGTGETSVENISIENGKLKHETKWEGRYDQMPNDDSTQEIFWSNINDRGQIEKLAGKEVTSDSENASKYKKEAKESNKESKGTTGLNGSKNRNIQAMIREEKKAGRMVLDGKIRVLTYMQVLEVQGVDDPNPEHSNSNEEYIIFILSNPQKITAKSSGEAYKTTRLVKVMGLADYDYVRKYNGKNVTISVDLNETMFPSDVGLPLGEPMTANYKILDGSSYNQAPKKERADDNLASKIKNTDQIVRAKNTNMREDHSKNSAILKTLLSGTEVHVIDTYVESPERMWCKIRYEGVTGWISYNTINGSIK